MQPQDTPTAFLIKLWPWIEANRNRLIAGGGIVIVAIFLYFFLSWQRDQKEINAGVALSQSALSLPPNASESQWADFYLKIANQYPDTLAGRRAWLQGAAALFAVGKYADAQAQFQKFLDAHPDSEFSASAALGVAASLEALGKLDPAIGAYRQVANGFSSQMAAANAAKFALARIDGQQGKLTDALNFYESIVRSNPGSPLAQSATLRAMELRTKMVSATPAAGKP
jgi:predicted negative regulator of RcsB-dependent stress response